jgi:hypothetical protein
MVPVPGVDVAPVTAVHPRPRHPTWPAWADLVAVATAFAALAVWTWGGWPDVLVDFGRELYVAWRVSEGDVLYRDIASFYGPLSPYVNAAWFRLFGVGLRTLALCNMAILAAATAALWAIVRKSTAEGRWGATVGALAFLPLLGFAQLVANGSFNFVCPYSHEATHGFALAAAAVLSSLRLLETGRLRWAAAAGTCGGLAFLTKPESFVAGAGASGAVLLLALVRPGRRPNPTRTVAAFLGSMLVPPAAGFALLATAMPAREAGTGVLGSWAYAGHEELRRLPYFAWSMGTGDVAGNIAAMIRAAARQAAVLAPAAALAWITRGRPRLAAPLAAAAVMLALAPSWRAPAWLQVARPLPLWALAALVVSAWALRTQRHDEAAFTRHAARFALAAFALLLLPRMLLNARLYHYGFVLAGPGVLLVVAALVDWIPAGIDRRGGSAAVFRSASLAALAVAVAFHLGSTQAWLRTKSSIVGDGPDRFRAGARGAYVGAAMQAIAGLARPSDMLVVLPEGVMINYLLRMRSSIPYLTMLPSDVAKFGEAELLGSLQREPPPLILLVHRETSEFGPRFLGLDYGLRIAGWISERYQPVGQVGDPPLRPGSRFGMTVLRRRADARGPLPAATGPP